MSTCHQSDDVDALSLDPEIHDCSGSLITFVLGFWIAYFLVFHVRNLLTAIGLFLVCARCRSGRRTSSA